MNNRIVLIFLLWAATACAPSERPLPTAIVKPHTAEPTWTPVTPSTTLATSGPTMTSIPSPTGGYEIGNLHYALPSTGHGWCLVNTDSNPHVEIQHLSSSCQPSQDPGAYIDLYYFHTKHWSVSAILHFFVQDSLDAGFGNVKLQIMDQVEQPYLGTVTLASLDMTDAGKPVSLTLYAFLVRGGPDKTESYIIQGSGVPTPEGTQYLDESMKSLLDSIVVAK